jgi:hypothetical protein
MAFFSNGKAHKTCQEKLQREKDFDLFARE